MGISPDAVAPPRGSCRRWNEDSMEEAVAGVEKGIPVRHAAEMYIQY